MYSNDFPANFENQDLTRRDALKTMATAGAGALLSGCASLTPESTRANPIPVENSRPGTRDWMLQNTRVDPSSKYRCPWIEGYCSHTSVKAGETISFHVSTNPVSSFQLDIYRMGYYGGTGGRLVHRMGPIRGMVQPEPIQGEKRLRDCQWESSASLRIPEDWVSGVYLGKLTAEREGLQSYVIFIVRDERRADFIFQCSDTTWQSYNRWPDHFSLYDDGKKTWYYGPNVAVSFNRPYARNSHIIDNPLSTGSGEWFLWEFPMAYWMESLGYNVTYISNLDTHSQPDQLLRAQGFLSVGHDEYYTLSMFQNLQGAIRKGLSVAFFSGNTSCGRIEFLDEQKGRGGRIFERTDLFSTAYGQALKSFPEMKGFPAISPEDRDLIGAGTVWPYTGNGDFVCSKPDHWIFAGTGMKAGDSIQGLIGWEYHGNPANIPGLEVVSTGPAHNGIGKPGTYTSTIYPGPKHNFVFNASTCWWVDCLSAPPGYIRPKGITSPLGPDPRGQQITKNVLARMVTSPSL